VRGHSIPDRIAILLEDVSKYEIDNPRLALLHCRMIAEAILMQKHVEKVNTGDVKNIISIGDINSKSLGLNKEFNELQKSSFEFIKNSTSLFLHFNYEEPGIPQNLVERVVTELKYLLDLDSISENEKEEIIEFDEEKESTGWKEMLELELKNWNFKKRRILNKKLLEKNLKNYESGVKQAKKPESSNALLYVSGINELRHLDDKELLEREKALIKSILIIFYQRHGGPDFNKKRSGISNKELRLAMKDADCVCGPHIIKGQFLRSGSTTGSGKLRLIHDWEFMKLV
jgi:hypothetical protein